MLMHQQDRNTGWHGFWNFHDGDRELSGVFQTVAGFECNFQARLDPELGTHVYRGSAFNLNCNIDGNDEQLEWGTLLVHQSTYTRDADSGSLWQRRWQTNAPIETVDGRRLRRVTRMRDALRASGRAGAFIPLPRTPSS